MTLARLPAPSRRSFLAGVTALAGCSAVGGSRRGAVAGTLRYTDGEGISGLNDHLVPQLSVGYLGNLTQGFLLRYGPGGHPYGDLATEVPTLANGGVSRDGLAITYRLRRGLKWSDGAPFSAADVVFTVEATLDPAQSDLYRSDLLSIADATAHGPDEVVLRLKRPYAPFTDSFFSSDAGCILPAHLLRGVADIAKAPYSDSPVGLGPFTVQRWNRDQSVEMTANPSYHGGRPKLDRIVYEIRTDWNAIVNELKTGDLDLACLMPAGAYVQGLTLPGVRGVTTTGGTFTQLGFNLSHPPLDRLAVRRALRAGTDRRLLVQKVMHGLADLQESPLGAQSPHRDAAIPFVEYDPAGAIAILEADGWRPGPDGIRVRDGMRLAIQLVVGTGSPERDAIADILQSEWQKIGVALSIKHAAATLLYDSYASGGLLEHGKFDVELSHQGYGIYGDLGTIFECGSKPPGVNVEHYCDPAYDRAAAAFAAEYRPVQAQRDADAFQEILAHDLPDLTLFIGRDCYLSTTALEGFTPGPTFDGAERWSLRV